jgi:maleylpyruvate isomerase
MRTREVWLHAVDLNNGGSVTDFPAELVDRLQTDVLGAWSRRQAEEGIPNFVLRAEDRDGIRSVTGGTEDGVELLGTAAALTRWVTGRGSVGVLTADGTPVPKSPRWL